MLTSNSRTAARQAQPTPRAARRAPPLATLAVTLLIVCSGVLGVVVLVLKLYVPALLFWTISAGLTLGRQVAEQSRLANTRFEEMTHELRLIRHGLSVRSLTPGSITPGSTTPGSTTPEARDLPISVPSAPVSPGDLPR
ncbi:hypothetical protein [Deinococcus sp.]|uniref:hypothetical protein n=1 Tax=Deinococcus sp. TaxID=47478 RepID=UPI00286EB1C7|nr:hypothetical protein [Deinococcus sp.]